MTYRAPDAERAADQAAVVEAARLDEAAALQAMRNPQGLTIVRAGVAVLIFVATSIGGALVAAFIGAAIKNDAFLGFIAGCLAAPVIGLALAVLFMVRTKRR